MRTQDIKESKKIIDGLRIAAFLIIFFTIMVLNILGELDTSEVFIGMMCNVFWLFISGIYVELDYNNKMKYNRYDS